MLAGVATSQTTGNQAYNDQLNGAVVLSDQTLNVVTDEGVTADTSAVGNSFGMTLHRVDGDLTSNQDNRGATTAHVVVNAPGALGDSSQLDTVAVGNSGMATALYGTLSGVMVQTNTGAVTARSQIEGETAQAGDVAVNTQAAGNSQGVMLVNGSTGARISQNNQATVAADGGAIIQYVAGSSDVTGTATGNGIDLSGYTQSAARIVTDQNNGADNITASKFTAYGNSYLTTTTATAAGNSLNAANDGTLLDVTSHQYNTAYVRAQAEESSYDFGGAQATAYGVGNTAVVSNSNGPGLVLDNVQVNDGGGVEAIASFEGNDGYDAGASATAVGNAVASYACTQCGGTTTNTNSQANNVDVSARATVNVAAGSRSVYGVSRATGNSATYSVGN